MSNNPVISIITVVYNSEQLIEKTIKSILSQSYKHIEYIIIDGASKDRTMDIINHYRSSIAYVVSEKDKGLYDAMNKGIKAATGDFLWFINSGDELYASDTIEKIIQGNETADVIYGETMIVNEAGEELGVRRLKTPEKLTWKSFKAGMVVSHQAILVRRSLAPLYDLNYRFSADFNWVLAILQQSNHIVNSHLIIARFLDGGLTKSNIIPGLKERFRIMCKYYGTLPTLLRHIPIGLKFLFFVFKHRRF